MQLKACGTLMTTAVGSPLLIGYQTLVVWVGGKCLYKLGPSLPISGILEAAPWAFPSIIF